MTAVSAYCFIGRTRIGADIARKIQNDSPFISLIIEIRRGNFKQLDCGKVMLPLVVLRRFVCILADSKEAVLAVEKSPLEGVDEATPNSIDHLRESRAARIAAVIGQIDVTTWGTEGQTDRRLDEIEEKMSRKEATA